MIFPINVYLILIFNSSKIIGIKVIVVVTYRDKMRGSGRRGGEGRGIICIVYMRMLCTIKISNQSLKLVFTQCNAHTCLILSEKHSRGRENSLESREAFKKNTLHNRFPSRNPFALA